MIHEELKQAILSGNKEEVDRIISTSSPEELNTPDQSGQTLLSNAAVMGDNKLIDRLIAAGADTSLALTAAARSGNIAAMELLLRAGADLNLVLSNATKSGDIAVTSNLIKAGFNGNIVMDQAMESGDMVAIDHLLKAGVDSNRSLIEAARSGNIAAIGHLLKAGADANYGLAEAARSGNIAAIDLLLKAGVDVNDTPSVIPLLALAAESGNIAAMERLVKAGADVNKAFQAEIASIYAKGDKETLTHLISLGADANQAFLELIAHKGSHVNKGISRLAQVGINTGSIVLAASRSGDIKALEKIKILQHEFNPEIPAVDFTEIALEVANLGEDVTINNLIKSGVVDTRRLLSLTTGREDTKLLLRQGIKTPDEQDLYYTPPISESQTENLRLCEEAKRAVTTSIDEIHTVGDKERVEAITSAIVFSSDKSISEIAAPESKEFIDDAVRKAEELHSRVQSYDMATKDFIEGQAFYIDAALMDTNPKTWRVEEIGAQKALINLAASHGGTIKEIETLRGGNWQSVQSFIDNLPEKDGQLLPCLATTQKLKGKLSAVGRTEQSNLSVKLANLAGNEKLAQDILSHLKPEDIKIKPTQSTHVSLAPGKTPGRPKPPSRRADGGRG